MSYRKESTNGQLHEELTSSGEKFVQVVTVPTITSDTLARVGKSTKLGEMFDPIGEEQLYRDLGIIYHTWSLETKKEQEEDPPPQSMLNLAKEISSWTNPRQSWRPVFISFGAFDKDQVNQTLDGKKTRGFESNQANWIFVFKFRSPNPPVTHGKLNLANVFLRHKFPGEIEFDDTTHALLFPQKIGTLSRIDRPARPIEQRLAIYGAEARSTYPQKGRTLGVQTNKPYELMIWVFLSDIQKYLKEEKKHIEELLAETEGLVPKPQFTGIPNI